MHYAPRPMSTKRLSSSWENLWDFPSGRAAAARAAFLTSSAQRWRTPQAVNPVAILQLLQVLAHQAFGFFDQVLPEIDLQMPLVHPDADHPANQAGGDRVNIFLHPN